MQLYRKPRRARTRHLDTQIAFCRAALDRGKTLAVLGELETASRAGWLVEDATTAIRPVLANVAEAERLDQYQRQLARVLRDLSEL